MREEGEVRARLKETSGARILQLAALGITDYGKAKVLQGWKEALEWVLDDGGNKAGNAPGDGKLRRKAGVAKQAPTQAVPPDRDAGA